MKRIVLLAVMVMMVAGCERVGTGKKYWEQDRRIVPDNALVDAVRYGFEYNPFQCRHIPPQDIIFLAGWNCKPHKMDVDFSGDVLWCWKCHPTPAMKDHLHKEVTK
jgi:hypothetical protein